MAAPVSFFTIESPDPHERWSDSAVDAVRGRTVPFLVDGVEVARGLVVSAEVIRDGELLELAVAGVPPTIAEASTILPSDLEGMVSL